MVAASTSTVSRPSAAERVTEAARLLLDQARILEGETPTDPARFAKAMVGMMLQAAERQ